VTRAWCFACAALALLAGCHDQTLQRCDITQPDCQQDIYYADLRLRGDSYDPFAGVPPIRTISEDLFRAELEYQAAVTSKQAPQPWWDASLLLLGLVPSTGDTQQASIDNQVQNTAAFYSPDTRDVAVISHPEQAADPMSQFFNMSYLAHELVHALQDHEISLNLHPHSTDEYFAEKALIEGDASLYQRLFEYQVPLPKGYHFSSRDPLAYFSVWRQDNLSDDPTLQDNFASLGPPFFAASWLVYPLGGVWLSDSWDKGGNTAVRHAYGKAPQRSLDYLLGPGVPAPASKNISCGPSVPAEFKQSDGTPYGRDSFGAINLFAYLMAWHVPASDSLSSSLLWLYDVIFVYYNQSTQKTAVTWRIELDSPLPAAVLASLTTAAGPGVVQNGTTLLITNSDDPAFLSTWDPWSACPFP
jgi:hypothetical protein